MIVGFTITDFKGNEKAAVDYINRVCILESPAIAQNIVNAGPGVNIFSSVVTLSELRQQPFSATPIETQDGKILLSSAVNFNIEITYNGSVLRLVPTEYIYIEISELPQFEPFIQKGLVRVFPDESKDGRWIMENGAWNDNGVWVDSNVWRD